MKLFTLPDSDDNEAEQILDRCLRPGGEAAEVVEAPGGLGREPAGGLSPAPTSLLIPDSSH